MRGTTRTTRGALVRRGMDEGADGDAGAHRGIQRTGPSGRPSRWKAGELAGPVTGQHDGRSRRVRRQVWMSSRQLAGMRSTGPGDSCSGGRESGAARCGPSNTCSVSKSQNQSSPGSNDRMMGCPVDRQCADACRASESSQHPMCPHAAHRRRCTHHPPSASHSTHPEPLGGTDGSTAASIVDEPTDGLAAPHRLTAAKAQCRQPSAARVTPWLPAIPARS